MAFDGNTRAGLTRWIARAAGIAVVVATCQCGSVAYYVNILNATQAVEEARQAGAEEAAPYEYFYARAFLDKAREEAGEAEYQAAVDFAGVAHQYGERAREMARRRGRESGR